MDLQNIVLGKKTAYRKAYNKTEKVLMMMSFFGTREWKFQNDNIKRLANITKKLEFRQCQMDFDIRNIDWNEYFKNYIPGIKKYYFKESCENVEKLRTSYQRLKKLHNFIKYLLYFIFAQKVVKVLRVLISKVVFKMIVK